MDSSGGSALITGGARGIGRAVALRLAKEGITVAIGDRKAQDAKAVAEECAAAGAPDSIALGFDQSDPDAAYRFVDDAVDQVGPLRYLFANAGTGAFSPFVDMDPADWKRLIDVNVNGTFYVCQGFSRHRIVEGGGGSMVLNASSGADTISDLLSAYCTSKAGVAMLMKHIAAELGSYRIRANAIMPGVVESPMTSPMISQDKWRLMVERETPMGRWGQPEEVAELVAFLLSEKSGYITGSSIMIDGGSTLHGAPRWYSLDYSRENEADWEHRFAQYPYA